MDEVKHIGYHGTDGKFVSDIRSNGFRSNQRDDHWLGQGIYFYSTFELANWWICAKLKKLNQGDTGAVIKVELTSKSDKVLDLDEPHQLDGFFQYIREKKVEFEKLGIPLDFTKGLKNDANFGNKTNIRKQCFFMDIMKKELGIELIIRTFSKNHPSYASIKSYKAVKLPYNEKQLCASNNDIITIIKDLPSKRLENL